ncbi:SusC/RagA family TonB-linked outer membrane protein [Segetibacter sp. 3557_3]|uniref:SusC/RagA family TonB-linked outer membrane protein n=1 Tax=Segetibacter sp. 3557_3 TaxID=2547429 RepID=UPI001058D763|nr:SusC/RagA family TonB-linked outer membrane protein [Segetibacter sp. 3557_3]TDH21390.1 SusC/RagA family TonB-linked outer membrane protein [Segetibacter sp. 3557_3]
MKYIKALLFCVLACCIQTYAQKGKVVTGTVNSKENNQGLATVTVTEKGTTNSTVSDANGNFSLRLTRDNSSLVFSYVGFGTEEVSVATGENVRVSLTPGSASLDEVVVTAFGIRREKKSLGYTVQTVNSEDLNVNRQSNVVNALQGKVAGVTITSGGGAPGAGARIMIRGINSLDASRGNQPIFIVDGVEVDNSTNITGGGDNRAMSNRAADINPDDIETISVLRSGAATALYGIRAANGAIIITTKSARAGQLRINYTGTYGVENVLKTPEVQTKFTKGSLGVYDINDFFPSWGPTIAAAKALDPTHPDEIYNNYKRGFRSGYQTRHTINLSGGTDKAQLGASLSYFDQTGVLPFSDYKSYNARVNGNFNISSKIKAGASLNFINSGGSRVNSDRYGEQLTYWSPRYDVMDYIKPDGTQKNYNRQITNPVYQLATNRFYDNVNRIIASGNVSYAPTDWLNFVYRFGNDFYTDQRTRTAPGPKGVVDEYLVGDNLQGFVHQHDIRNRVITSTFMANVATDITKDLSIDFKVGHDLRDTKLRSVSTTGDTLIVPELYLLQNARRVLGTNQIEDARIYGIFGDLTFGYKNLLFLNVTHRNDFTSTLSKENRSYGYSSASLSYVFSDMFKLPTWWSYGKFKASYAKVGKDATPYATTTGFITQVPIGNLAPWTEVDRLGNPNLRPEFTQSYETGLEFRFLKNRIGADITLYRSNSKDLLVPVKISNTTGFDEAYINAGEMENKGIEISLNAMPVKTRDFSWNFTINYSSNKNKVVRLNEGLTEIVFGGTSTGYLNSGPSFKLIPGYAYGALFGITNRRYYGGKPEDPMLIDYEAPLLIGADGFPIRETDPKKQKYLGNTQPRYIASTLQTLNYKQWSLSLLVDIRQGQRKYNQLANYMAAFGIAKYTENRTETIVFPGVLADGTPNTKPVYLGQAKGPDGVDYGQGYYRNVFRGVTENFVEDASWVRLRSLTLSYALPTAWLKATKVFNGASISLTGNNVWLSTKYTGFDPESSSFNASSNIAEGFSGFTYPGVRSFLATVNLQF